ncbi:thiopeptide-type bacteriocin biosynthesis protein [Streptosporangium sp. NBC_01639]|uniref:thiopeptide-type bacteriocin biosynthesis protein n=1 Tax=Streptosporangium sp. NBC_01639 TaxID=2975948 RepID=UPI0038673BDD|nr:thiopeptide-type bacteriocin biosynthesis protein [Streptosporangium sp. NBC_01639]
MTAIAPQTPSTARGGSWISAHLFHAGDLDTLITELVPPLVTELAPSGMFFLRYWEGGPHLRLRLLPRCGEQAGHLHAELARRGRAYLAANPSPGGLTSGRYRAMAAHQAAAERLNRHDDRLRPGDTLEFIAYRPEHHAYGDGACMDAVEAHFTASSRLALDLLRAHPDQGRRTAIALAALTLTLAAVRPDPTRLAVIGIPHPPAVHQAYLRHRPDLHRQSRHLWTGDASGALGIWSQSIHRLGDALTALGCAPEDAGSPLGFLARTVPPARRPVAEVLLRCTHLFNNRLGLTRTAEFHTALLTHRVLSDLITSGDLK